SIQLKQLSLRNLGPRCLLTDLPDEWMGTEVVEEELEQNLRLRLCEKPLMRLTVERITKKKTKNKAKTTKPDSEWKRL
ncbi:hypothetical protein Tco_0430078, partial [Tanacetum coccineum]